MNAKELRMIVIGIGVNGSEGTRALMDHKVRIVAAIDTNDAIAGKDLGEYVGYPTYGLKIEKELLPAIQRTSPNIAFVASDAGIKNLKNVLIPLAEHKINVAMPTSGPYMLTRHCSISSRQALYSPRTNSPTSPL